MMKCGKRRCLKRQKPRRTEQKLWVKPTLGFHNIDYSGFKCEFILKNTWLAKTNIYLKLVYIIMTSSNSSSRFFVMIVHFLNSRIRAYSLGLRLISDPHSRIHIELVIANLGVCNLATAVIMFHPSRR